MDLEKLLDNIAHNLKYLREGHNYTQIEVSHYLACARRAYQKLEYGEVKDIRLSTIVKILKLYNITFEKLIEPPKQK